MLEGDIREGAADIDAETRFAVRLHGVSCHWERVRCGSA
jgi:hypothetical protein